jgi:2-amino-4-hydroxy-6-hydroxymethyldihydropteridine diphosphokinase
VTDIAYVALGSNMGDREGYLRTAREALAALPGTCVIASSSIDETEPLGPPAQAAYLNQMLALDTSLDPRDLLRELQRIESAAGRLRLVRWGPRTLDLDIVCYERATVLDPDLIVPHPALADRPFWQRQLAQVRSGRTQPGAGLEKP